MTELGNHLWQSTLFAASVALACWALRKNRARTRYWLWLAASGKFLIPFSLLVSIGSNLAWVRGTVETKSGMHAVIEELGQPFVQPTIVSRTIPSTTFPSFHLLPIAVVPLWL